MGVKYFKLAYAFALRANYHGRLSSLKGGLRAAMERLDDQPKLRFAVGDQIECLDADGEWQRGKVIEIRYYERDSPLDYCAPYRVQLLGSYQENCEGEGDVQTPSEAPELLIIEADLDTLIRKVGKISIEETRWESRLDAKIAELSRVYCSKEFIQAVYTSIKADAAFCTNLEGGRTPMTLPLMYLYRMLIMYRKPFVRTDSGYHVPT